MTGRGRRIKWDDLVLHTNEIKDKLTITRLKRKFRLPKHVQVTLECNAKNE